MATLLTIGLLGFLIFVHELGHLLAAKAVGIPVERFSIGFGRVLWKRRIGGVEYCLSLIPLGGYVMPAIENEQDLFAIPISRRIIFWLGGPAANFLCAALMLSAMAALGGATSPYALLVEPWIKTADLTGRLVAVIPMIFTQPDQLSGVVGIVAAGKAEMSAGLISTLKFATVLNLNLAVFNLLPIAPLDGGKIFCSLLEKVHPKLARVHTGMAVVGLALLLGLMLYTTVMDVFRQFA